MNKISIIVPVYNSENTLDRCIQSILAQTRKDFELILTDDGSDDSSLAICRRYAENDSRVKVFRQSHAGASAARNTGIRHSSGEYLMFVDADDFIEPEMLERFAATAQDTCADYILSGMVVEKYDSSGRLISEKKYNHAPRLVCGNTKIPEAIIDLVENHQINGPCCKLVKRAIVQNNRLEMPEHLFFQEDLHFNLKILEHTKSIAIMEGTFYHYIKSRDDSLSERYHANHYETGNELHDLLLNYYTSRSRNPAIINRIKNIYGKLIYRTLLNLFKSQPPLSPAEKMNYIKTLIKTEKYQRMMRELKPDNARNKLLRICKNPFFIYCLAAALHFFKALNARKWHFSWQKNSGTKAGD